MLRLAKALLCAVPLGSALLAQTPPSQPPANQTGKEPDKAGAYIFLDPAPMAERSIGARMTSQDFVDLTEGKANGQQLFFTGKLKVEGDMSLALRLQPLMDILK